MRPTSEAVYNLPTKVGRWANSRPTSETVFILPTFPFWWAKWTPNFETVSNFPTKKVTKLESDLENDLNDVVE